MILGGISVQDFAEFLRDAKQCANDVKLWGQLILNGEPPQKIPNIYTEICNESHDFA